MLLMRHLKFNCVVFALSPFKGNSFLAKIGNVRCKEITNASHHLPTHYMSSTLFYKPVYWR